MLGTVFRFWTYRTYVFTTELADDPVLSEELEPELNER